MTLSKKILVAVGILCLTFLAIYSAHRSYFSLTAKLDNYIQAYVDQGFFSGAVLVAKDGKILLSKGYGMANYELDVPNTPHTKFRLGSITKQFTAMIVMQLQEKGLLKVTDPLSKYIPDYPHGDAITIYRLLTHTSGVSNVTGFPEYQQQKLQLHTLEQLIELFKHKPLDFEPGTKYSYSNSNYMLLTYIIEKASGKKYETLLKENIFDPLGMKDSGYDHAALILKDRASGYSTTGGLANASYIDMSFPVGAGGLYSTVEDLYRWDQALYSEKLASQQSLNAMFTPCKEHYACGWCVGDFDNHKSVEHGGGIEGFSTDICRYTDDHVCIIVLSNFEDAKVNSLAKNLQKIVFGQLPSYTPLKKHVEISLNPEIYNQYVGKYKLADNFIITITKENDSLFAQATAQEKLQIFPESETEYFWRVVDAQVTFVKDNDGRVTQLILHQGGQDTVAEKIE